MVYKRKADPGFYRLGMGIKIQGPCFLAGSYQAQDLQMMFILRESDFSWMAVKSAKSLAIAKVEGF